jgi:hypothetical protein
MDREGIQDFAKLDHFGMFLPDAARGKAKVQVKGQD